MKKIFTLIAVVSFYTSAFSQSLSGNKIIDGVGTDPNTYASIKTAITDLNTKGVDVGGVTFLLPAGYTYSAPSGDLQIFKSSGGASDRPIVFKKDPSTSGANPLITGTGGAGTIDAVIVLSATAYVTFDGIDVAAADNSVEFGYFIRNRSATEGATYNTVKNCKITMDKTNPISVGLCQRQSNQATIASGENTNNTYSNLTIENVGYCGINLDCGPTNLGSFSFKDQSNTISTCTIGGVTAGDIGSGNTTVDGGNGIRAFNQENFVISNCEIKNVKANVSSAGAASGIYALNCANTGNIINNCYVHDISDGNALGAYGVRIDVATSSITATWNVYNNVVYNIAKDCFYMGTSNGTASNNIFNLSFNSAYIASSITEDANILRIYTVNATPATKTATVNLRNNNFANFHTTGSFSSSIINNRLPIIVLTSNYNNLYVANPSSTKLLSTYTNSTSTVDNQTLAGWQNATTSGNNTANDLNSFSVNPNFTSTTDLKPQNGNYKPGISVAGITTDIVGATRFSTPSIGAYESLTVLPVSVISFTAVNDNGKALLKWSTASEVNNNSYTIKHSTDGVNWTVLGVVNSNTDHKYTFVQKNPANGANYYGLEQTDNDGTVSFLGNRIITFPVIGEDVFVVYPNPVVNFATVQHTLALPGATIKIISLDGKILVNLPVAAGTNQTTIDLGALNKGIYFVKLDNAGKISTVKVLKK